VKQGALDWDLDPAEWTAAAPPAPRAPAPPPTETAVLDERGRARIGTVIEALPGTAYPYTAACGACGTRQSGWSSVWSAEMWVRHHRTAEDLDLVEALRALAAEDRLDAFEADAGGAR